MVVLQNRMATELGCQISCLVWLRLEQLRLSLKVLVLLQVVLLSGNQ